MDLFLSIIVLVQLMNRSFSFRIRIWEDDDICKQLSDPNFNIQIQGMGINDSQIIMVVDENVYHIPIDNVDMENDKMIMYDNDDNQFNSIGEWGTAFSLKTNVWFGSLKKYYNLLRFNLITDLMPDGTQDILVSFTFSMSDSQEYEVIYDKYVQEVLWSSNPEESKQVKQTFEHWKTMQFGQHSPYTSVGDGRQMENEYMFFYDNNNIEHNKRRVMFTSTHNQDSIINFPMLNTNFRKGFYLTIQNETDRSIMKIKPNRNDKDIDFFEMLPIGFIVKHRTYLFSIDTQMVYYFDKVNIPKDSSIFIPEIKVKSFEWSQFFVCTQSSGSIMGSILPLSRLSLQIGTMIVLIIIGIFISYYSCFRTKKQQKDRKKHLTKKFTKDDTSSSSVLGSFSGKLSH